MSRRRGAVLLVAVAGAIVSATIRVRSDDPVSSNVRFTREIVRIFDRKCLPCHASDGLAVPLTNYRDVRAWGRGIREEIVEQRMPPSSAARGYGRFLNDLSLSARETTTVLSWIDGGMPRGDDRDLPPPARSAPSPPPDVRVALPRQRIPALEDHVVRRVTVSPEIDPSRPIAKIAFAPGARRALRGALMFEELPGGTHRWIGAWRPWQEDAAPPAPHGFRLTPGARLSVELHYRGGERDAVDESAIGVIYAPDRSRPVGELAVDGSAPQRLARDTKVWAIVPSAGRVAGSLELTARRPDGSVNLLLWIPRVHREWPQALVLDQPLALPAGTSLSLVASPRDPSARARLSLLQ